MILWLPRIMQTSTWNQRRHESCPNALRKSHRRGPRRPDSANGTARGCHRRSGSSGMAAAPACDFHGFDSRGSDLEGKCPTAASCVRLPCETDHAGHSSVFACAAIRSVLRRRVNSVDQFPAHTPALASSCAGPAISFTRAFVGYVTAADFAVHAGADARPRTFDNCRTDPGLGWNCAFLEVSPLPESLNRPSG